MSKNVASIVFDFTASAAYIGGLYALACKMWG
jgi:hypothetical protein